MPFNLDWLSWFDPDYTSLKGISKYWLWFSHYILFNCLEFLFVLLLICSFYCLIKVAFIRIHDVSILHAFHHWFCMIIQRILSKSYKFTTPFLPLVLISVLWGSTFKVLIWINLFLHLFIYICMDLWFPILYSGF